MTWEFVSTFFAIVGFAFIVVIPSLFLACCLCVRDAAFRRWQRKQGLVNEPFIVPIAEPGSPEVEGGGEYHIMSAKAAVKPIIAAVVGQPARSYNLPATARADYLGGIPRLVVISCVGAFSTLLTSVLSKTTVVNKERLIELVNMRPPGTPLITVSNHMSTLDDPLMFGHFWLRASHPKLCKWTLTAKDICFTNPFFSSFFRIGKLIPVERGGGIQQEAMFEAIDRVNEGDWLHTFPEGKIQQAHLPLQRMKWGVASIIARSAVPPIVLCIGHSGYETVMPEEHVFGRRAMVPLWGKRLAIVVGEPMEFDLPAMRAQAEEAVKTQSPTFGEEAVLPLGPDPVYTGVGVPPVVRVITRQEAFRVAGDEATKRLYSQIMKELKINLEKLVFQAHEICSNKT